jgi:hypothetical protein
MTAPHADQLIDGYLARLRVAATDLSPSVREELIEDMRAHIAEARTRESEETDATILNILDRLGEPDAVVAEAGRRPDAFGSSQPGGRSEPYRPGILEIAAVILVPFFWPIGVILLWISPAWKWRDKLIGTLVPPGGYIGLSYIILAGPTHVSSCVTIRDQAGHLLQSSCTGSPELPGVLLVPLTILVLCSPLISAAYLAIRLRWGRRAQGATALTGAEST